MSIIRFLQFFLAFTLLTPGLSNDTLALSPQGQINAKIFKEDVPVKHFDSLMALIENSGIKDQDSLLNISDQIILLTDTESDSFRLHKIIRIAHTLLNASQYHASKKLIQKYLPMAEEMAPETDILPWYLILSEIYFKVRQHDSSQMYLLKAGKIADDIGHTGYQASILNSRARIADVTGNRPEAIELYHEAAGHFEKNEDYPNLVTVLENIGTLHMSIENDEQAISYLVESLKIRKKHGVEEGVGNSLNNLGVIYKEQDSLVKAKIYFLQAMEFFRRNSDEYHMAMVYMNLANVERREKNFRQAISYFDSSRALCHKNGIEYGVMVNHINLGELYLEMRQPTSALEHLHTAEKAIAAYSLPEETEELYRLLSEAYLDIQNPAMAYDYYRRHIALRDSISGVEIQEKILELEKKFENERTNRENIQLQQAVLQEKARNRSILIMSLLVFILLFTTATFLYIKNQRSKYRYRLVVEKNEKLKMEIELKDEELMTKALNISRINELLHNFESIIEPLSGELSAETDNKIQKLFLELKNKTPEEAWNEFELRFNQVHKELNKKLIQAFPDLTPAEIRICNLLYLDLSTKEISVITNRSLRTIDNTRYNIRKKMGLNPEENLSTFLISL